MSLVLKIHATHPQQRLIDRVVDTIREGGVVAYPTDSGYALGCQLDNQRAIEKIRRIRELDKDHNFTLVCRDLSEIATYARVDNTTFRLLKAYTPGPYTFILAATKEVPKRFKHPKKNTIGVRIPDHPVVQAMLETLHAPIMSVSLLLPEVTEFSVTAIDSLIDQLEGRVDTIVDSEASSIEPTSVVDLTTGVPVVMRQGRGSTTDFG